METRSRKLDALLGAIVLGVVALFVWLSFAVGGGAPRDAHRYVLLFDSALGLHEDNAVAVAGVQVGVVDEIGIEGRRARVVVALDPGVELHEDARAAVRAKSLLGEKYIDIDPGAPPAPVLASGATLENNVPTVEIDEVIRSVSQLVSSLNVIAPPLEAAVSRLDHMLHAADGEQVSKELAQTLADAGALIRETNKLVSESGDDVRVLLKLARDKGPGILDGVQSASNRVDALLASVDPKVIEAAADRVPPTLDNLDVAANDLKIAMADIRQASDRLEGLLMKVDRTLTRLDDVNERSIREFLQVEGVRVNLIPDAKVERRIRKLRNEATPLPVP